MAVVFPDGTVDTRYRLDSFLESDKIDDAMSSLERIVEDALNRSGGNVERVSGHLSEGMSDERIHEFYLIVYREYVKELAIWDSTPQRWAHYELLRGLYLSEDVYIEDQEDEELLRDAVKQAADEVLQLNVA